MKNSYNILYIVMALVLAACSQEEPSPSTTATGTLVLNVSTGRLPKVVTRATDSDLVIELYESDGTLYRHYDAGAAPDKLKLEAGKEYTVKAFTDNQDTWLTANDGKGAACFIGDTTVTMEEDATVYCTYKVPMTNYAVTFTLPELFDNIFSSKTFTVKCGSRTVELTQGGEKAYFSVDEGGFSYQLQATNTDGKTSSHSAIDYPNVEAGKQYNVTYSYSASSDAASVDVSDDN